MADTTEYPDIRFGRRVMQFSPETLVLVAVLLRQHGDDCREQGGLEQAASHYALAAQFYTEAGVIELAAECGGLAILCH